jgi:hypothetical protein
VGSTRSVWETLAACRDPPEPPPVRYLEYIVRYGGVPGGSQHAAYRVNDSLLAGRPRCSPKSGHTVGPQCVYIYRSCISPPLARATEGGRPRREGGGARGAARRGARPQLRPATAAHTQTELPLAPPMVVAGWVRAYQPRARSVSSPGPYTLQSPSLAR